MYGNGAGIGTETMQVKMRPTLRVPRLARTASGVAAAGTTLPLTVVRLTATTATTRRRTATTTWAFALFAPHSRWLTHEGSPKLSPRVNATGGVSRTIKNIIYPPLVLFARGGDISLCTALDKKLSWDKI